MSSETDRGGLYVVSAPSGAGKTSLLKALIARYPRLAFSVSYATRRPRPDEVEGRDYHFIDAARFERMRSRGEFLESATVYGNGYGTGAADVERLRAAGRDVVLEIDWQGARQVRERVPETISVFILPPSRSVLRARLTHRGTDSEETITRRMAAAAAEIRHWCEYDYVIVNEDFARALADLEAVFAGRGAALGRSRTGLAVFAAGLVAPD
ncbi:MAG: guanylate kinase [Gammaproteobacteria bacterium]